MKAKALTIHWHQENQPIYSAHFQPSSNGKPKRLATGGGDNNVRLWRLEHEDPLNPSNVTHITYLATLAKHTQAVNVVRFDPKGNTLASAGDDGTIILWSLAADTPPVSKTFGEDSLDDKEVWKIRHICRSSISEVYDLAWSPDSQFILAGSMDNIARVYNAVTGQCIRELAEHSHYVQGVTWDPYNEYLATQSSDRSVHIYNLKTKDGQFILGGHHKIARADLPIRKVPGSNLSDAFPPPPLPSSHTPTSAPSATLATSGGTPGTPGTLSIPTATTTTTAISSTSSSSILSSSSNCSSTLASATSSTSSLSSLSSSSISDKKTRASNSPSPHLSTSVPTPLSLAPPTPTSSELNFPGGSSSPEYSAPDTPTSFGLTASNLAASTSAMNPPSVKLSHSRKSSFGSSAASSSVGINSLNSRPSSPTPSFIPLPAVRQIGSPSLGISRSSFLYHNETFTSFFRRLTFTPDGSLLLTPSGIYKYLAQPPSHPFLLPDVDKSHPNSNSSSANDEITNTVYIYTRAGLNKPPVAHLPGLKKPSLAIACSPVFYKLRNATKKTLVMSFDSSSDDVSTPMFEDNVNLNSNNTFPTSSKKNDTSSSSSSAAVPVFNLKYRMVYAVITQDSVVVYDTEQRQPLCVVSNLNYSPFTDVTWSPDGINLLLTSTDGFCSVVMFEKGELGEVYTEAIMPPPSIMSAAAANSSSSNVSSNSSNSGIYLGSPGHVTSSSGSSPGPSGQTTLPITGSPHHHHSNHHHYHHQPTTFQFPSQSPKKRTPDSSSRAPPASSALLAAATSNLSTPNNNNFGGSSSNNSNSTMYPSLTQPSVSSRASSRASSPALTPSSALGAQEPLVPLVSSMPSIVSHGGNSSHSGTGGLYNTPPQTPIPSGAQLAVQPQPQIHNNNHHAPGINSPRSHYTSLALAGAAAISSSSSSTSSSSSSLDSDSSKRSANFSIPTSASTINNNNESSSSSSSNEQQKKKKRRIAPTLVSKPEE